MKPNYYSIGQMAKMTNLSEQTLRYYDRIGLFKPIYTDDLTNYRYYAESQLYALDLIKSLKYVGTPLEKIKEVQHYSAEDMMPFLKEQEKRIENQLAQLKEAQYILRKTRKQMDEQLSIPTFGEVYEKQEDDARILCLEVSNVTPESISAEDTIKLIKTIENEGSVQTTRYGSIYPLKNYQSINDINYQFMFIPILTEKSIELAEDNITVRTIPSGRYISIAFVYSPKKYIEHYKKIYSFIEQHQIQTEMDVLEIVMPMHYSPNKEEQVIIELKLKIKE